jgi:NADPH:quinone reductase-like Zn-dependent oxidoreductase
MTGATTTAILIDRLGPPEALVAREVPLRDPGPGEVHLRVEAAGVNFADLLMRVGLYGTVPRRPFSPGFEVAGRVVRVGPGVGAWRAGDRAAALLRYGGYTQDLVVPERQLFHFPECLTSQEAAAVPVVFLTAWIALLESARVRAGETALVLGAGGGVGTAAIQLAHHHGLRVIGVAGSPRKREFVMGELKAAACLDSHRDWEAEVRRLVGDRGIDVALDPVGGQATVSCRRLLAPLGRLVFYGLSSAQPGLRRHWVPAARAWLQTPRFHPLSLIEPNIGIFGIHLLHLGGREALLAPALEQIYGGVASGTFRAIIDRSFPFTRDGAVAAHRYLHERRNLGKVMLVREANGEPSSG